jgi:hypothetical protein
MMKFVAGAAAPTGDDEVTLTFGLSEPTLHESHTCFLRASSGLVPVASGPGGGRSALSYLQRKAFRLPPVLHRGIAMISFSRGRMARLRKRF